MLCEILCKTQKINTIQAIKMHFTERLTERSSTARVFFRGISTEPLQRRGPDLVKSSHSLVHFPLSHVLFIAQIKQRGSSLSASTEGHLCRSLLCLLFLEQSETE